MGLTANRTAERAERRAMIALMAVFALLVQALIPSIAAAGSKGPLDTVVICTSHGLQSVPDPANGVPDQPCQHCVCPTTTALPPAIGLSIVKVRFAAETAIATPFHSLPPPARGPPRPPGQGPPRSDA